MTTERVRELNLDYEQKYGFADPDAYLHKSPKGLSHETVEMISRFKAEPDWMREFRHRALDTFLAKPLPHWGNQELLGAIDFADIHYYVRSTEESVNDWDDVPENIKRTFTRLGIPEAEQKFLAGVTAQYDSEVVYHSIRKDLEAMGVVFTDMDSGLAKHADVV
ncbi:MAG: Fe-S cluster assembly protein SufB, partial [Candidatus Krumholzibacteria bacterium]|nr:Fe-S cluster assembly protein SufB [Candidatus Krumholzibacteria bacterium]